MNEIRDKILTLLNTENNIRSTYIALERLILVMLADYIEKQEKEFYFYNSNTDKYDAYAPMGFDQFEGKTVFEFKFVRSQSASLHIIRNIISRTISFKDEIENLIIVFIGEMSKTCTRYIKSIKGDLDFNVTVWSIEDLLVIFSHNIELFNNTYSNLNTVIVKETINRGIQNVSNQSNQKNDEHIKMLSEKYKDDKVVLFLGSGVSKDAGISTWNELISNLYVKLVNTELEKVGINISASVKKEIVENLIEQNNSSPLLQARFLRQGFADDFEKVLSDSMYNNLKKTSNLIDEIVRLCTPNRGKVGIQAIVNYNFDDLIEQNLQKNRIKYNSVYNEGVIVSNDELGIYHVHGFLPQNREEYHNISKSLLVFSEEGYHKLILEPYNWANITQLNYLINNTCVFIGLSMTDPNLRRLLEISAQKHTEGEIFSNHYTIMKRDKFGTVGSSSEIKKFESVNESMQESIYRELGVNVIWIDSYSEIPNILKKIKEW